MKTIHLKKVLRGEHSLKDVLDYLRAQIRYFLHTHTYLDCLLPYHISEQVEYRMAVIRRDCYNNGQCQVCGCSIPQLLWANKQCEGKCYPPMVNRKRWQFYQRHNGYIRHKGQLWVNPTGVVTEARLVQDDQN